MHWRSSQVLAQKLSQLRGERDAATRGSGLELFIANLFGHEHFRVDRENLSSNGRQVDLFLTRGQLRLLVETKWTKRAATIDEIDQLLTRLQGAPPNVVGLLVSMSGFSRAAIKRVEQNTQRPVLLLTGDEVDRLVERGHGLHALVTWKLDHLTRYQRVEFGPDLTSTPPWLSELPEAGVQIFTPNGDELPCWESAGGFHGIIHSISPSNVDWGLGTVVVDFNLGLDDATGLVDLLKRLAQAGWMTHDGAWRIEQSAASWNGFSSAELARQLHNWTDRYRGNPMHHTEQVIYLDHFDDGLFTLTADVAASPHRWVRWCSMSFLLTGIPLDTSPYEALTIDLPVLNNPKFRSVDPSVHASGPIRRRGTPVPQTALAHLARHSTMFGEQLGDPPHMGRKCGTSRPSSPRHRCTPRCHRPARGQPRQRSVLAASATSPHRPRPLRNSAGVVTAHQRHMCRAHQERLARPHPPQPCRGRLPREAFARIVGPVSACLARATRRKRPISAIPVPRCVIPAAKEVRANDRSDSLRCLRYI